MKAQFNPETYHPIINPVFPFLDDPMGRLIQDLEERIIHFRAESMMATTDVAVSRLRAKADTLHLVRAEIILALEETELGE
jgi:uncharacterized protein (DUF1499 family)